MNSNFAFQLYHTKPISVDKKTLLNNLSTLIENLRPESRNLKESGLLKEILQIEWKVSESRDKAFIQAALCYLEFLKMEIEIIEGKELSTHIKNLKIAIEDMANYVNKINFKVNLSFIYGNTNTQPTPSQFDLLKSIFYKNNIPENRDKYLIDLVTVPILRTILESKVKSILGIDIINDSKNRAIEVSKLLGLISKSKVLKVHKSLELSNLNQIFEWLNHMMHRNVRPDVFVLHCVLQYLQPIFESSWIEKDTRWSIYASAFVHDIAEYKEEIKNICEREFMGCCIIWTEPEVYSYKQEKNPKAKP